MPIFEKTQQDEARFQAFLKKVEKLESDLAPFADCIRLEALEQVRTDFQAKIENFYRKDRKLNIGVIGQVKAGKSSFLNTLLFEGKKVLPSAATPKTAALTKIEYGQENLLQVEYYTPEEWSVLEERAQRGDGDSSVIVAKEIMKMVREQGVHPAEYTGKGKDEFHFDSAGQLMEQINDYVGENGRYTALVKNVTIRMERPELRDISVVDTPGLNDAVASRTDLTRKFIKECDVVFFLSRASQFMDKSDMYLLTSQLPQDGVKQLVVLCSRFDDGLKDTIEDYDSLEEAIVATQKSLTSRAARVIDGINTRPEMARILEPCRNPVYISSLCWNAAKKKPEDYSPQERLTIENVNCYDDVDVEMLRRIGNMDTVQRKFQAVVDGKDETLSEIARSFLPDAEGKLRTVMSNLKKEAEHTLNTLQNSDRVQLAAEKKGMEQQIHSVQGGAENVFGSVLEKLNYNKLDTLKRLREASQECGQLQERAGTETKVSQHWVKDSKWWNPLSWGSGHYEIRTYEEKYSYLASSDALENIRIFGTNACTFIEQTFSTVMDVPEIKRQLLHVITENLDASSAQYDAAYFRLITEQVLNKIEFPVMRFDVSREQEEIAARFSGEVKDKNDQVQLQKTMFHVMGKLLDLVTDRLETQIGAFRKEIIAIENSFCQRLLENIQADFAQLEQKFEHKEQQIHTYENLLKLFSVLDLV